MSCMCRHCRHTRKESIIKLGMLGETKVPNKPGSPESSRPYVPPALPPPPPPPAPYLIPPFSSPSPYHAPPDLLMTPPSPKFRTFIRPHFPPSFCGRKRTLNFFFSERTCLSVLLCCFGAYFLEVSRRAISGAYNLFVQIHL